MTINWQVYREQPTGLLIKSIFVILEQAGEYRQIEVTGAPLAVDATAYITALGLSPADAWLIAAPLTLTDQQAETARRRWLASQLAGKTPAEVNTWLTAQVDAITTLAQAKAFLRIAIPLMGEILAALVIQRKD